MEVTIQALRGREYRKSLYKDIVLRRLSRAARAKCLAGCRHERGCQRNRSHRKRDCKKVRDDQRHHHNLSLRHITQTQATLDVALKNEERRELSSVQRWKPREPSASASERKRVPGPLQIQAHVPARIPVSIPSYETTKRKLGRVVWNIAQYENYWDRRLLHLQTHLGPLFPYLLRIRELVSLVHDYYYSISVVFF